MESHDKGEVTGSIAALGELMATFVLAQTDLAGKSVLEVGCGTGGSLRQLAPELAHGVGIDINRIDIQQASQLASASENISFECRDFLSTNAEELAHNFDVIVCAFGFHNFEPERFASTAKQMLNHNGSLILLDCFAENKTSLLKYALDQLVVSHIRDWRVSLTAFRLIGVGATFRFFWRRLRYFLDKNGRVHVAADLARDVPLCWNSITKQLEFLFPGCTMTKLLGSTYVMHWSIGGENMGGCND